MWAKAKVSTCTFKNPFCSGIKQPFGFLAVAWWKPQTKVRFAGSGMILKMKENLYVNKNKMIKVLQNTPLLFFFVSLLVGMSLSPRGCLQVQTFSLAHD